MKDACIEKLQKVVAEFQERRSKVTPEIVKSFQDPTRAIDPTPSRTA
jgi:tryptophanyl-tRNA synthetase